MTDPVVIALPKNLSHSQVNTLNDCGARWFYSRGLRLEERPGWALVGGSALHKASEDWDLEYELNGVAEENIDILASAFEEAFEEEIQLRIDEAEVFKDPAEWRASGRASKAWPEKENEDWWRANGPIFLRSWAQWRLNSPWQLAWLDREADSQMAVEVRLDVPLDGIKTVHYVDRVFAKDGDYAVVDLKTGSRAQDTTVQLGTYRGLLLEQFGIDARWGGFWSARKGYVDQWHDLSPWTKERISYRFRNAREKQRAGIFDHSPSNMCTACGVNRFCPEWGGDLAGEVPQPWEAVVDLGQEVSSETPAPTP